MAEQLFCKQLVGGSIPFAGSNDLNTKPRFGSEAQDERDSNLDSNP
jgi:hypothetical protein